MECSPFQEPKVSMETIEGQIFLGDTIFQDAQLTPKEQAVIEMVVYGQMTLQATGIALGVQFRDDDRPFSKRYVLILRDNALRKMRNLLNAA